MLSQEHYGENLVQNYFGDHTKIYEIIQDMQQGKTRFDAGKVAKANVEVQAKSGELDNPTYKFAQDLSRFVYGLREPRRVVMFVEGTFYGRNDIETIIPFDLGNNPHQLFKKDPRYKTVDDAVTFEETRRFLERNGSYLSQAGFDAFQVGKSRFFYFKESDLSDLGHLDEDGRVKMTGLVPLIVPTKGYVVTEEVEEPSLEDYMQFAPLHVSYRFKKSLMEKIINRMLFWETEGENIRLIADWVAHRPVVEDREAVDSLEQRLIGSSRIGINSSLNYEYTNDYYSEEPKKGSSRQFKVKNVVVTTTTRGSPNPTLREIQIVDRKQYFENELSKDGEKSREEYEEGRSDIPRRKVIRYYELRDVLEQIFIVENEVIPIRS